MWSKNSIISNKKDRLNDNKLTWEPFRIINTYEKKMMSTSWMYKIYDNQVKPSNITMETYPLILNILLEFDFAVLGLLILYAFDVVLLWEFSIPLVFGVFFLKAMADLAAFMARHVIIELTIRITVAGAAIAHAFAGCLLDEIQQLQVL